MAAIGLHQPIVDRIGSSTTEIQAAIDRCDGVTAFDGSPAHGYWLIGAHRTACGSAGFQGVESLRVGTIAVVTDRGRQFTYALASVTLAVSGQPTTWADHQLILQTSQSSKLVYLARFTLIDS